MKNKFEYRDKRRMFESLSGEKKENMGDINFRGIRGESKES